jgi:acyl-CoA synthetase (AMP-forming)/AMP-acid ligase II
VHLSEIAAAAPGQPAVIMSDGSATVTYGELDRRSLQVSRLLSGLGVGPGDHVALTVLAVVQPAGDGPPPPGLADELVAHCRSRLASFKCPRTIEFARELPRLPTGKLLRRQLRAERT